MSLPAVRFAKSIAPVVAAIFCNACTGSLLESKIPVPTTYVLAAEASKNPNVNALPIDIAVSQPTASPGLDTERIALLHEARRLDYYLGSQWGAALPQVVQSLVVGSLQNQKWFRSVTSEQARVNAAYLLDLDIRDFQAEYSSENSAPIVRVTLTASLIRVQDRKLIASIPATAAVNATSNRMGAVIAAFESGTQQAALSIGQETVNAIHAAKE